MQTAGDGLARYADHLGQQHEQIRYLDKIRPVGSRGRSSTALAAQLGVGPGGYLVFGGGEAAPVPVGGGGLGRPVVAGRMPFSSRPGRRPAVSRWGRSGLSSSATLAARHRHARGPTPLRGGRDLGQGVVGEPAGGAGTLGVLARAVAALAWRDPAVLRTLTVHVATLPRLVPRPRPPMVPYDGAVAEGSRNSIKRMSSQRTYIPMLPGTTGPKEPSSLMAWACAMKSSRGSG